jgi:hypothetical protein
MLSEAKHLVLGTELCFLPGTRFFVALLLRMTVSRLDPVGLLPPVRKKSSWLDQIDLPPVTVCSFHHFEDLAEYYRLVERIL